MRTTVNLPDALLERAKRRAAEEKLTLGELIESALADRILRRAEPRAQKPFRLISFGKGGLLSSPSVEGLKHLDDSDDIERALGKR